jgi:hypothetical protein
LIEQIQQVDWSKANEIEQFLSIFYETVKEFNASQEPMFQKVDIWVNFEELKGANTSFTF